MRSHLRPGFNWLIINRSLRDPISPALASDGSKGDRRRHASCQLVTGEEYSRLHTNLRLGLPRTQRTDGGRETHPLPRPASELDKRRFHALLPAANVRYPHSRMMLPRIAIRPRRCSSPTLLVAGRHIPDRPTCHTSPRRRESRLHHSSHGSSARRPSANVARLASCPRRQREGGPISPLLFVCRKSRIA